MNKMVLVNQNKDELHNLGSDGLLSRLPDEILVCIVSKLPLRDAVVTSRLSRRWRYLWCQTDRLLFDNWERWGCIDAFSKFKSDMYMSVVNHIIRQHKASTIDKFKIRFRLDENAKDDIDKWITFAVSKKVQTLELNLCKIGETLGNYCFPNKLFDIKCGYSLKRHSFNDPLMEIKFLKSLVLRSVDVDDEGLNKILDNCPALEHLSIVGSCKLVEPEIHGNGLALKNLEITYCKRLESIEICDSNIVFFNCLGGSSVTLIFDNVQKLEKISIREGHSWNELNDMFCQISCLPYLQVLELYLRPEQGAIELHPFPKLQKLKQLVFNVLERDEDGLLVLPSLLEACPNLQTLTIMIFNRPREEKPNRGVTQMAKNPHQSLEVVKMVQYHGWTSDLELFMYFLQNCVALKKLVIEPVWWDENAARYHAQQQLKPRMPVGVELVIL